MAFELAAAFALMATPAPSLNAAPTLDAFEAVLSRHDSATLALEEWCAARGLGDPARITAHLVQGADQPAPDDIRTVLAIGHGDTVSLRNVRLNCGAKVLSVAWNWYVAERLTPAMNAALGSTDIPFGKAVAALQFRRKPLSTVAGAAANCPPETISTHQAMLLLPDGRPLAYLVECYTAANLEP
ncbi:hypothetical protein [Novosphingobium sp. ST904]|uniref:hypothetical protein n=2 Tax=Novosphingobium sp. ST904 TaxID=1684385 RepID=UPI0006C843A5|nr:hypothetical protein [Novosphingobium sp. ST904]KPH66823.1 hypothetical protein ADT71_04260 [Novosphingobium sp. ST904]TCM38108.1 hypothetical protein EDF59_109172 [Novosphingobium sp. ST904]